MYILRQIFTAYFWTPKEVISKPLP